MIAINETSVGAIDAISRARTDGGLGVCFDGENYMCRDVRSDPAYADYWPLLVNARLVGISIPRWKGRAYLASLPAASEGPLAAFTGATLLDQIDAFATASFTPAQRERYLGTQTWERYDPMIAQVQTLLGLTDVEVDDWFATANAFT